MSENVHGLIRKVDRIPWPITAVAGLIGFLVLIRFVHQQIGR